MHEIDYIFTLRIFIHNQIWMKLFKRNDVKKKELEKNGKN